MRDRGLSVMVALMISAATLPAESAAGDPPPAQAPANRASNLQLPPPTVTAPTPTRLIIQPKDQTQLTLAGPGAMGCAQEPQPSGLTPDPQQTLDRLCQP